MSRAEGMGFDTGTPLYHGTDADFQAHRLSDGSYGRSVYTTTNPEKASNYSYKFRDIGGGDVEQMPGSNVHRLISSDFRKSPPPTNYQIDDPSNIRSQFARFDPRLGHLSNLNAANASPMTGLLAAPVAQETQELPFQKFLRGLFQ